MRVAIDISPLHSGHYLQHRVRGTGFYLQNLREGLLKYQTEGEFLFFNRGEKIPNGIDLIHYPYFEPFFLTIPLVKRKKTVVTVHDLTPLVFKDNFPVGVRGEMKWRIQKNSLERSDAIIADSNSSKRDILRFLNFDTQKVHVVYLAAASHFKQIPVDKKNEVKHRLNLPDKFALYVGDATWNKNLPRLIEAINKTDYYLVIAGGAFKSKDYDKTNPWNKDLAFSQALAEKNEKIISLGFVENDDLAALYNAAILFVMPSLYEGFGLPILEAMQSGCPAVTSKSGSLREVAEEAAYFVDPLRSDSIAHGIKKVWEENQIREKLSKAGLKQAKKFSWDKSVSNTIEVYKKAIYNK